MNRKQITTAFILLAVVIAASAGSWLAGSRIQSPAEAAARTAPPAPSPILVPIEERVLTADVVTRGTARFGLPQSLSLAPSPLKGEIGVITTPASAAQGVADLFMEGHVNAILNFAPTRIDAPDCCLVENIDFTVIMDILTYKLHQKMAA